MGWVFQKRSQLIRASGLPSPPHKGNCPLNADVAELVDALGLGSSAERRGGSSPLIRTIISVHAYVRGTPQVRCAVRSPLHWGGKRLPGRGRGLLELLADFIWEI